MKNNRENLDYFRVIFTYKHTLCEIEKISFMRAGGRFQFTFCASFHDREIE